jgi:hypothetical protein
MEYFWVLARRNIMDSRNEHLIDELDLYCAVLWKTEYV